MYFPRTHTPCVQCSRVSSLAAMCTAPTLLLCYARDSGPQRGAHVHIHVHHWVIRMMEGLDQQQRLSVASVPKNMSHSRAKYDDCTISTFLTGVCSWITMISLRDVMIWRLPQRSSADGCGWLLRSCRWKSPISYQCCTNLPLWDGYSIIFNRWTKLKLSHISETSGKHLNVEVVSWLKRNALDLTWSSSLLR